MQLTYWPSYFTTGIVFALISAVGLVIALMVGGYRRADRNERREKLL